MSWIALIRNPSSNALFVMVEPNQAGDPVREWKSEAAAEASLKGHMYFEAWPHQILEVE